MQPVTAAFIYFPELRARYGEGRRPDTFRLWLWRATRAGRFPAPIMLGPKTRAWRRAEVLEWEASLQPVPYAPRERASA